MNATSMAKVTNRQCRTCAVPVGKGKQLCASCLKKNKDLSRRNWRNKVGVVRYPAGMVVVTCRHCGKTVSRYYSGIGGVPTRRCDACALRRHSIYSRQDRERIADALRVRYSVERVGTVTSSLPICRVCGQRYERTIKGIHACSDICRQAAADAAKRKRKASKAYLDWKQAYKASKAYRDKRKRHKGKRKARLRGAVKVEAVDPLKVFERDGYRCGLCGKKTKPKMRGTYHPLAPELDHIVSIADGGDHTYSNTQCAHRKCNSEKGAVSFGQFSLFP